jgi:hypothetical protein
MQQRIHLSRPQTMSFSPGIIRPIEAKVWLRRTARRFSASFVAAALFSFEGATLEAVAIV